MTLEEAEKEVFNNKKNEPDSLFSDYGQTENAFGGESLFEDTGPTVSVFNTDTSGYLPAVGGFLSNGAYAWYSNIGGREVNEDCVKSGTFKDNFIAVVADGLGGEGDGERASEIICESLMKCGADGKFPDRTVLKANFESANRELLSKQKNKFHMKSTAVYLCIQGNKAIWAHIGDSRLYHLFNGKIREYTMDHSASQMAVLLGEITREQIPSDPGRSRLLRAMGSAEVKPDIHDPVTLEPGLHGFLLCTDGLWEYLSDDVIAEEYSITRSPKEFINKLYGIKLSKSEEICDNSSAVAVFWKV